MSSPPAGDRLASEKAAVEDARSKLARDIEVLDREVRLEVLYRMEKLAWKAVAGIAAAVAGLAASKALAAIWGKVRDGTPPDDPVNPGIRASDALLWTAMTGVGVGIATVIAQRGAARGWAKATGRVPPPFEKKASTEAE